MTLPRPVYPGQTVMSQKRCIHGQFRLRPDPGVVQIFLYLLGYCAAKYEIELHEFVGMSNHDHEEFTDPRGNGPRFLQTLHALVARAVNHAYGEWDSLWSGQRGSTVRLLGPDDVKQRCIYVLLNPVEAGLVRYARDWTGVTSWHLEYGRPMTIKRPEGFFSDKMPKTVEIVLQRPPGLYPELNDREARRKLKEEATAAQSELIARHKAEGRTFMGMKRVLRQPRHHTPNTQLERRGIRPHVAGKSKWARIEALSSLTEFWRAHAEARRAFEAGDTKVDFPYGTYLMQWRFGVRVRPPP